MVTVASCCHRPDRTTTRRPDRPRPRWLARRLVDAPRREQPSRRVRRLAGSDLDGRASACSCPTPRALPAPLLLAPSTGRCTVGSPAHVLVALGHPRPDVARGAGRPRRLHAGQLPVAGHDVCNHEWCETGDVRRASAPSRPRASPSSPAAAEPGRTGPAQPSRRRARHRLGAGPGAPHEVVGISGGNKYFFPGVGGQKIIDVSHWLGALITSCRDHRHHRHHAGARAHRRRRRADPVGEAGALRGHRRGRRRCRRQRGGPGHCRRRCGTPRGSASPLHSVSFGDPVLLGVGGRGLRSDPHHLSRRPGPPGAVDHPGDVRRDLDRREGLLQARTGSRRRRRGDPVRPAHHARSPPRTRRSTTSATTAATTS